MGAPLVRYLLAIVCAAGAVACSSTEEPNVPVERVGFTSPEQFVVDKNCDLAAVVRVLRTEIRWEIIEHGDHMPMVVAVCEMERDLSGSSVWFPGTTQTVVQFDYSSLFSRSIAPPVIDGRRYVLLALTMPEDSEIRIQAAWMADSQGFLLVRGRDDGEFVYWSGKSYLLSALRETLSGDRLLPLDEITDPVCRLRVAEERLRRDEPGEPEATVRGLMMCVRDPEGEANKVVPDVPDPTSRGLFGMSGGDGRPHALWYKSLALLRDFGRNETHRPAAVAALTPLAKTARPHVRLAVALALVDLGSDAGHETLVRRYETEFGQVGSDLSDSVMYPGRYPYDDSSVTSCAHALARLGDRRGLKHAEPKVRLAAAEAFENTMDDEVREVLVAMAAELEPAMESLRSSGELAQPRNRGNRRNRVPTEWTRTHRLLARGGDDRSLRLLAEAYLVDAATYPKAEAPLMPTGMIATWSRGPSPATAIRGSAATPAEVLSRLERLFENDARWNETAFVALRACFADPPPEKPKKRIKKKPTAADIEALLNDSEPERRGRGLAAAGYHRMAEFHARVLDAALNGQGVERRAAVYALGFYGRDIPDATLRRLMDSEDLDLSLNALELATRKKAGRFAPEAMNLVRRAVTASRDGKSRDRSARRKLEVMPRIICRLARGPIPPALLEGLEDPDPSLRYLIIHALWLAGNPDAVPFLEPLTRDADPRIKEAALAALRALGPPGE
jgi:HEAT repeat protein